MSYFNKYLKYKNKYLKLKKKLGGGYETPLYDFNFEYDSLEDDDNKEPKKPIEPILNNFYIYTTGLAEWGTFQTANVWQQLIRDVILKNIPSIFNNIIINHYDPLVNEQDLPLDSLSISTFNKKIVQSDNELNTDQRHITSTFFREKLNIALIQQNIPHIVLDMAHIFKYNPPNQMSQKQIYIEPGNIYTNINSVYPGYSGLIDHSYIAHSNFIKVDNLGNVTTYIDKIYQHKLQLDPLYQQEIKIKKYLPFPEHPDGLIEYIYKKIELIALDLYRKKHKTASVGIEFDDFMQSHKQEIYNRIIELIMDDQYYNITTLSNKIHTDYIIKII
jgi:hypothetical protein